MIPAADATKLLQASAQDETADTVAGMDRHAQDQDGNEMANGQHLDTRQGQGAPMTTDRELADKVEEWLHGRELQYATIKLMADVIYALRRSQPEGEMVMVPREQLAELLSMVPVGIWGPSGKKLLANIRAMLTAEAEGRKP